ncbi:MAG: DUF6498-containing protein [Hellea sp.]
MFERASFKLTSSGVFLILANCIPIIGIFLFGWDAATILVLYWLESVIIGIVNIPKILACRKGGRGVFVSMMSNLFICVFYMVHYGIFTGVHGVFLAELLGARPVMDGLIHGGPLVWTAFIFFVSHLFSMLVNFFGKKEYLGRTPHEQMFSVYGRVFVMHIVIIFTGFAALAFGAPIIAVIMLIGLKTVMDLAAHNKEHQNREAVTA